MKKVSGSGSVIGVSLVEEAADAGCEDDEAGEDEGETDLGVAEFVAEVGDALVLPVGAAVCFDASVVGFLELFVVFLEAVGDCFG